MALAYTPEKGISVQPGQETTLCDWTADGNSLFIGFMGTGSYSGLFILRIDGEPVYWYYTSPSLRTAYVADRYTRLAAGKRVTLSVQTDSSQVETFYATLLGGLA